MVRSKDEIRETALWLACEVGALFDTPDLPIDNPVINKYLCELLLSTRNQLTFYREFDNKEKSIKELRVSFVKAKSGCCGVGNVKPSKTSLPLAHKKERRIRGPVSIEKLIVPVLEKSKCALRVVDIKKSLDSHHKRSFSTSSIYSALTRSEEIYNVRRGSWGLRGAF